MELNVYEAGTGAVRSIEATDERWDLMSGFALGRIRQFSNLDDYNYNPIVLVNNSVELIGYFLGGSRGNNLERAGFKIMVAVSLIDHPTCKQELVTRFQEAEYAGIEHLPYWGLVHLATTCHEGATKYGEENWHHGFTVKSLCNRAIRHCLKWVAGDNSEDHLGHAMWNVCAAIHMIHKRPDMCKLLLGPNWTITEELQAYHDEHASRRRMVKEHTIVVKQDIGIPDPFETLPNGG